MQMRHDPSDIKARHAIKITLHTIGAHLPQQRRLLRGFDAIRDDQHFELLRHSDQRLGLHLVIGIICNAVNETLVDLHEIKEEIFKGAERR